MTRPNVAVDTRRWRIWVLVLPAAIAVGMAMAVGTPMSDWGAAVTGARYLLSGHLSVYADMPKVQMGPLALLLAGALPGPIYLAAVCSLLSLMLWMVTLAHPRTRSTYVSTLSGGVLLAWPWAAFAVQGHGDDALVLIGVVAMVLGYKSNREAWVIAGFLVAITAKPTAVLFLPLVFLASRRAGIVAVFGAGLLWAPFILADVPGFIAAGRGQGDLWPYSLPELLGGEPHSGFPAWVRPVQLVGGAAVCFLLARRKGVAAAVAGVFAFRVLLEPATWNYYSASVIAAAILLDLDCRRRIPWGALLGFVSFVAAFGMSLNMAQGAVRILALTGVLVLAFIGGTAQRDRHHGLSDEPAHLSRRVVVQPPAPTQRRERLRGDSSRSEPGSGMPRRSPGSSY